MRLISLCAVLVGVCLSSALSAQQCDQEIATSLTTSVTHRFGTALAVSGNVTVAGDRFEDDGGAVYVFRFDGVSWIEEQILIPADVATNDEFGVEVAIDGDVIVASSQLASAVGACYVYRFNGVSWIEEQKLSSPTGQAGGWFGRSVSVSGDRILVGASSMDVGGLFDVGTAYLFQFVGGSWQLEETFGPSGFGREFGYSVDLDSASGTLVVGEPLGSPRGFSATGSASIYELIGGTWTLAERVLPPTLKFDGRLGESVSLSGDSVLIGAYRDDEGGTNRGAAYVYRRDPGGWSLEQKLIYPGPGDQVGRRVALSGDTAILSTRNQGSPRAVIYSRVLGVWQLDQELISERNGTRFGREVAIDGDFAAVGSRDIGAGFGPTSARIYTREAGEWTYFGFASQPQDADACLGESVSFEVEAEGVSPLTYQWRRDGIDIPGETSNSLTIDALTEADVAVYTVEITSPCGTIISEPADVTCSEFIRGDANGDGMVDAIGDGIRTLQGLFGGFGVPFPCRAAADTDANSQINIADAVFLLTYGFMNGPMPPAPFPDCDRDPAAGSSFLTCDVSTCQ